MTGRAPDTRRWKVPARRSVVQSGSKSWYSRKDVRQLWDLKRGRTGDGIQDISQADSMAVLTPAYNHSSSPFWGFVLRYPTMNNRNLSGMTQVTLGQSDVKNTVNLPSQNADSALLKNAAGD